MTKATAEMTWADMDARPRRPAYSHAAADIPKSEGVYAAYLGGKRLYVGKAAGKEGLRQRIKTQHLGRGKSMTGSAFRRNVAEHLGIASAANIKQRRYLTTTEDAARVTAFIDGTELAWIECANTEEAEALEDRLKAEYLPPLTKR